MKGMTGIREAIARFAHGFLLPFTLILATLRDKELRGPYVKTTAVRLLIIAILTAVAIATGSEKNEKGHHGGVIVVHHDIGAAPTVTPSSSGVHVDVPGVKVDLADHAGGKSEVKLLGQNVPVVDVDDSKAAKDKEKEKPKGRWAWFLAIFATISGATAVVIALSRRYDDWVGFGVSALASIEPEDAKRKEPKVAIDFKWLWKKLKERIRESVAFAAGFPLIALFQLVPTVGLILFKIVTVLWGWYWLGVLTAAKSDHALVDAATAPSPFFIREPRAVASKHWLGLPLRPVLRLWAWLTRSFDAPAAIFERTPAPFLGLGLAKAILSLPGLYVLAKPIVPVAAGRLIAESDPHGRFSVAPSVRPPASSTDEEARAMHAAA